MVDNALSEPLPPLLGLPSTPEQLQKTRRLAEAGTIELARIKEALELRRSSVESKPKDVGASKQIASEGAGYVLNAIVSLEQMEA
ncbi:hypothetical protein [Stenotrophomonas maltophilia]|uniref:hypothetical protein n=1 Tax=Stenotrophomonas maltophilia TaxID=40324 RepID=UPI001312A1EE|nr:hypothetical protein [Stenotrophomonas maltophilia]MBA0284504.1 hypothetical protein [Stenotrophomonas maltophilia]MBA0323771.1 hypothetical protein [Stenotrophomonas maltophilia]